VLVLLFGPSLMCGLGELVVSGLVTVECASENGVIVGADGGTV